MIVSQRISLPTALLLLELLSLIPSLSSCNQLGNLLQNTCFQQEQLHQSDDTISFWWDNRINTIFAPVDRIDVVNGEHVPGRANLQSIPLLHLRTVRWYSTVPGTLCTRLFRADECPSLVDDGFQTFRVQWASNAHGGYIIFGRNLDFSALLSEYACLFDPSGTYLLTGNLQLPWNDRAHLLSLFRRIWYERGTFRVYVRLNDGEILTYNPFQPPPTTTTGSPVEYGALVSLASGDSLPTVPGNDFRGYPIRIEVFRSVYSNPIVDDVRQQRSSERRTVSGYRGADITTRDVFQQALNVTGKKST